MAVMRLDMVAIVTAVVVLSAAPGSASPLAPYTVEVRREIVEIWQTDGLAAEEVARVTGVPVPTLLEWKRRYAQTRRSAPPRPASPSSMGQLGAPPARPAPETSPPRPRIKSDISAFGASGPGATPFTIKHGVQVQTFYQHSNFDETAPRDSITLRRLVLYAIGELGRPSTTWSYTLVAQGPVVFFAHAWVQEEFDYALRVRLGAFKVPVSRQHLAPTRELLSIDKALATRVFASNGLNPFAGDVVDPLDLSVVPTHGIGDNLGLQVWGESASNDEKDRPQFRYFLNISNGPASTLGAGAIAVGLVNPNSGLLYTGRLELQPLGAISYSEGALDQPKGPQLAVDLTSSFDDNTEAIDIDGNGLRDANDRQDRLITVLGLRATVKRFSIACEYFEQKTRPSRTALRRVDSLGWYYTLGYLLVPKRLEISYSDSLVDRDTALAAQELRERGPCLSYYLTGHKHKLSLDHVRMTDASRPLLDRTETRFQYLYSF